MLYSHYNNEQYLFYRCLNGIFWAFKLAFKGLIYFPLLITGYLITTHILEKGDSPVAWIGTTLLFGFVIYQFIFFLKGMLIGFKHKGNLLWILLFVLCATYSCIAPVWLSFETIEKWMKHLSNEQEATLTWLFSCAMSGYIYSRYHFLTNVAPRIAMPVYQAGINLALLLTK